MISRLWGIVSGAPWWLWVVVAAGTAYGAQQLRIRGLEEEANELALELDGKEALQDSTRELTALVEDLGGVLRTFQRRSFQAEIEADELDRRLEQESRARIAAEARIDSLRVQVSGTRVVVDTVTDTRSSDFHVRQEPFTVRAAVELPPPPASGTLDLQVDLDVAPIGVRVACLDAPDRRIRPAAVTFQTPPWLRVDLTDVRQEPEVCNPQLGEASRGFDLWGWVGPPVAGAATGYAVGGNPVDALIGSGIGLGVRAFIGAVF